MSDAAKLAPSLSLRKKKAGGFVLIPAHNRLIIKVSIPHKFLTM